MPLMRRICKRLAELLISPWATNVFRRAMPGGFEEHRSFFPNGREDAFDFDTVFPAVAKVIKILKRFHTGILNCR